MFIEGACVLLVGSIEALVGICEEANRGRLFTPGDDGTVTTHAYFCGRSFSARFVGWPKEATGDCN